MSKEMIELQDRLSNSLYPLPTGGEQGTKLTEGQMDRVVDAAARMAGDIGEITKGVVAIYRIRAEAGADVARVEAATRQIVASARAEIDRLAQRESHTRTRGQVVVDVIKAVTAAMETIPDVDSTSRHALVDSLRWLAEAVVKD